MPTSWLERTTPALARAPSRKRATPAVKIDRKVVAAGLGYEWWSGHLSFVLSDVFGGMAETR